MKSKILGTIGNNYKVQDCPFTVPKENMAFFLQMQNNASVEHFGTYGNCYKTNTRK